MKLEITIILIIMFFMILVSIQYTLNKILVILKEIKEISTGIMYKDMNDRKRF